MDNLVLVVHPLVNSNLLDTSVALLLAFAMLPKLAVEQQLFVQAIRSYLLQLFADQL